MKVLLVDDQKEVLESLKKYIDWTGLSIEKVYIAGSAKEAKLVLSNFEVDVMVTDIEMPEENGLSLFRWVRETYPDIEGVFLTSHADFMYAQEAIRMGGFDYVLQPARYEEIEEVLCKVWKKISSKKKIQKLENTRKIVLNQRNAILDGMFSRIQMEKAEEADLIYCHFRDMFQTDFETCRIYPALVRILKWKRITRTWEDELIRMTLCNVIEELFMDQGVKAGVACPKENYYWIFAAAGEIEEEIWKQRWEEFFNFISNNMDFQIAVYPVYSNKDGMNFSDIFDDLCRKEKLEKKEGVHWEAVEREVPSEEERPIEAAIAYIRKNLSKNISRTEVAELVHLNEEYFSRLFRQETGDTFKEFVMMEKMKMAKKLLVNTRLSVSIIASKAGYDNFSHFSKMFKKITDQTPQEYRKMHQKMTK